MHERNMLIAGNWKMNTDREQAIGLASAVAASVPASPTPTVDVALCPPFVHLDAVAGAIEGSGVLLGAQNMHQAESGAYTGEVAGSMLAEIGCALVILGHSERRQYFKEDDAQVNAKCAAARAAGLLPIICVGETLDQRTAGLERDVVRTQLLGAFEGLEPDSSWLPVLAYEPVWAIGTGQTATPEQAQSMHAFIRATLRERMGPDLAGGTSILYGGSMKSANAGDLLAQPDIDGGLIGGASLKADEFLAIIGSARKIVSAAKTQ